MKFGYIWPTDIKDFFFENVNGRQNEHDGPLPYLAHCHTTVLPAKSDSDIMFCLQIYQVLIIDRSLVY